MFFCSFRVSGREWNESGDCQRERGKEKKGTKADSFMQLFYCYARREKIGALTFVSFWE